MKIHSRECRFKIQDELYDKLQKKSANVIEEVEVIEGECETVYSVGGWCGSIQMDEEGEAPIPKKSKDEEEEIPSPTHEICPNGLTDTEESEEDSDSDSDEEKVEKIKKPTKRRKKNKPPM